MPAYRRRDSALHTLSRKLRSPRRPTSTSWAARTTATPTLADAPRRGSADVGARHRAKRSRDTSVRLLIAYLEGRCALRRRRRHRERAVRGGEREALEAAMKPTPPMPSSPLTLGVFAGATQLGTCTLPLRDVLRTDVLRTESASATVAEATAANAANAERAAQLRRLCGRDPARDVHAAAPRRAADGECVVLRKQSGRSAKSVASGWRCRRARSSRGSSPSCATRSRRSSGASGRCVIFETYAQRAVASQMEEELSLERARSSMQFIIHSLLFYHRHALL